MRPACTLVLGDLVSNLASARNREKLVYLTHISNTVETLYPQTRTSNHFKILPSQSKAVMTEMRTSL